MLLILFIANSVSQDLISQANELQESDLDGDYPHLDLIKRFASCALVIYYFSLFLLFFILYLLISKMNFNEEE